jgi:hypothetical protein
MSMETVEESSNKSTPSITMIKKDRQHDITTGEDPSYSSDKKETDESNNHKKENENSLNLNEPENNVVASPTPSPKKQVTFDEKIYVESFDERMLTADSNINSLSRITLPNGDIYEGNKYCFGINVLTLTLLLYL